MTLQHHRSLKTLFFQALRWPGGRPSSMSIHDPI